MKEFSSLRQYFIFFLAISLAFLVTNCTTTEKAYHKYIMRGSILEVIDNKAYLCIGTKHGAQVGQVLNVRHYQKIIKHPGSKGTTWEWKQTGKIKITKVVDEHFAWAEVISGHIEENDIAELE